MLSRPQRKGKLAVFNESMAARTYSGRFLHRLDYCDCGSCGMAGSPGTGAAGAGSAGLGAVAGADSGFSLGSLSAGRLLGDCSAGAGSDAGTLSPTGAFAGPPTTADAGGAR